MTAEPPEESGYAGASHLVANLELKTMHATLRDTPTPRIEACKDAYTVNLRLSGGMYLNTLKDNVEKNSIWEAFIVPKLAEPEQEVKPRDETCGQYNKPVEENSIRGTSRGCKMCKVA